MAKAKQRSAISVISGAVSRSSPALASDIGHVERAEDAVEITDGDQEQRRGDEVEEAIFHRAVDLLALRAEHQEPEGRDQQDLEPDIEVEDVTRQEGAADAGHQQHQQGKKP